MDFSPYPVNPVQVFSALVDLSPSYKTNRMGNGLVVFFVPIGTAVEIEDYLRLSLAPRMAGPATVAGAWREIGVDMDVAIIKVLVQLLFLVKRQGLMDGGNAPIAVPGDFFLVHGFGVFMRLLPGNVLFQIQAGIVGHPGEAGHGVINDAFLVF